jgi:hypothetical protein
MEELDRTPGTLLDTPSNEDRTVATTGTTDTTGTTGTTRTTGGGGGGGGGSSTKPASSGPNLDALMKALMLMQQRPEDKKEQYQLANMPDYEDLMYGLSSGETPYMRG